MEQTKCAFLNEFFNWNAWLTAMEFRLFSTLSLTRQPRAVRTELQYLSRSRPLLLGFQIRSRKVNNRLSLFIPDINDTVLSAGNDRGPVETTLCRVDEIFGT